MKWPWVRRARLELETAALDTVHELMESERTRFDRDRRSWEDTRREGSIVNDRLERDAGTARYERAAMAGERDLMRRQLDTVREELAATRAEVLATRALVEGHERINEGAVRAAEQATTRLELAERRNHELTQLVADMKREGFERPPALPPGEHLAPIELPAKVREAIGRWPQDSALRRQIEKFAVDELRAGVSEETLATKIAQGEDLADLLD